MHIAAVNNAGEHCSTAAASWLWQVGTAQPLLRSSRFSSPRGVVRGAGEGKGDRLERSHNPRAAPGTKLQLQPCTSNLARGFLLSQLPQAGSAVSLVLFLTRFCLLRSASGLELAAPGGVTALAVTTLVPKITPAVLAAPHPRDFHPRHRL